MSKRLRKRLLVTRLERLKAESFGPLLVRALPAGGALGDVSLLHESLPPRSRLPFVSHASTFELVLCLSGSMTATLGKSSRRVRAGGIILIPPGTKHRFATRGKACECLSVFSPALTLGPGADVQVGR